MRATRPRRWYRRRPTVKRVPRGSNGEDSMDDRERRFTVPHASGTFRSCSQVMNAGDMDRAIRRMTHEVIERNHGSEGLVVIGLQTGGVSIAGSIASNLSEIEGSTVPVGTLDTALHRDDIGLRPVLPQSETRIPVDLDQRVVVLVDDVLFTGRTVRAAWTRCIPGDAPVRCSLR